MRTTLLVATICATLFVCPIAVGIAQTREPGDSQRLQLLKERLDLLKAATEIPASYGLPEGMDFSELITFTWLNVWDAELQLTHDPGKRTEIRRERLKALQSNAKKLEALYEVGARGGDWWRVLRSRCLVIRGQISLVRGTAGSNSSSAALQQIAELRTGWRKTAQEYVTATRAAIAEGFTNPQLMLPALAELQDAELAGATSSAERIAARKRHVLALRSIETACRSAKPKSDRSLTFLSARAQRVETVLRITQDSQSLVPQTCDQRAITIDQLKYELLKARAECLKVAQERFWEGTVWMEALLAAYRRAIDAELDLCHNRQDRQATLSKWIGQLARLQLESSQRSIRALSANWEAECAAEQLRLTMQLDRLNALPRL